MAALRKGWFKSINVSIIDDQDGRLGRSAARNKGVEEADADWIFFLDADDLMHPNAFKNASEYVEHDAIWGNIMEFSEGVCAWRYQTPIIRDYKELIAFDPYYTIQMGHFIRKDKFIPFDEDMNCGEDWKYYLKIWQENNCIKIEEPLFLNRRGFHSTGPKSATGREWSETVSKLMEEARNDFHTYPNKA